MERAGALSQAAVSAIVTHTMQNFCQIVQPKFNQCKRNFDLRIARPIHPILELRK